MEEIKVNLENLTTDEREQLMKLVAKGNGKESKMRKLAFGQIYWSVKSNGTLDVYCWGDNIEDKYRYEQHNCFCTVREALFELERRKVIAELQNYADEHNGEIDWNNQNQFKYFIYYKFQDSTIHVGSDDYDKCNITYFSSAKIARSAIVAIGADRLKKYYFQVED